MPFGCLSKKLIRMGSEISVESTYICNSMKGYYL